MNTINNMNIEQLRNIILHKFYELNFIKYGDYQLKSGVHSNIYIDLRAIISYPILYEYLYDYMILKYGNIFNNEIINGIQFGGLGLSNYLCNKLLLKQIFIRNEKKTYGTGRQVEGNYKETDSIFLIDDVMTTGKSINDTILTLKTHNLNVTKILVIVDRSEGHAPILNKDITPHSSYFGEYVSDDSPTFFYLFTLNDITNYLSLLSMCQTSTPIDFNIKQNNYDVESNTNNIDIMNTNKDNNIYINYFSNKVSNKIYNIALSKKTNIIFSADLTNPYNIISIINNIGDYIAGVKFHFDIIDFNVLNKNIFIQELLLLKYKYNLFFIEDRKISDIGNIVRYQINDFLWMDAITAHSICGEKSFTSIKPLLSSSNTGIIMVTELSSKNNLISNEYINESFNIINNNASIICGIVAQKKVIGQLKLSSIITFSPGINLTTIDDIYGQQYNTLNNIKSKDLGMFWIIGRGIYESNNINSDINKYKQLGWDYFVSMI